MKVNGSDGIPLAGRAEEYATELWLEGPSAFWLHPEGPLSDTTPEEYLAKQREEAQRTRDAAAQNPYVNLAGMGRAQYAVAMAMLQSQAQAQYYRHQQGYQFGLGNSLAGLLGIR